MLIGRDHEIELIESRLGDRSKAQLIVVYGRRRVGKSFLIRQCVKKEKRVIYFEGIEGADTQAQIERFLEDLAQATGQVRFAAKSWSEAFRALEQTISKGRWVIVMDEFPWMAAGQSKLVAEFKSYWDKWTKNKELACFLCGSVASFMVKHLIHSKALHNRKTLELCLAPLTPQESAQFIPARSDFEKAQLYMTFGGIPKYLEQIDPKRSLHQNINRLCFTSGGFFVDEYETLFKEQYRAVKTYQSIVELLARQSVGVSELGEKLGIAKGGGLNTYLLHLENAQFIKGYSPHLPTGQTKKRTVRYKVVDPFLLFYLRYIHDNRQLIKKNRGEDLFRAIAGKSLDVYYGLAFERFVEDSYEIILRRLGLGLVDVISMGPYFQQRVKGNGGLQIDQLIMRRDRVWTLIECKYSTKPIGVDVISEVAEKINRLPRPPEITVEPVLIAAAGVTVAVEKHGFFSQILTLKNLL